ncbi:serine-rich adhesin for platelets-like isoform X1 [Sinocyclocheilus rhinocerous]|uniref:Absent in melanoma 1 protein-like n=1 Tax=Sinocyclocheilus rhinocerous TaxID=307959 RepID=A0A673K0Q1_9TELE|nr:PREDICTED: serine-rich adhesin for platelets-like isoform X1 [Sinocyclocheilus rhinocerous]
MAKKSFSTKKSLRNLFSKSEANLKESVEKDDSGKGILKSFKWKSKKSKSSEESLKAARTESGTLGAGDSETQDDEKWTKRKTSLFGTVLRSKKVQHSYSESDLRKTKGFNVSLSWKKKKKKTRDLSQDLSSNSEDPGVKDHISEQEEFDSQVDTEQNQAGFAPESSCTSDQSQSQDVLSEMSRPNKEDAGFMPSDLDSTSIPYIDSSLSDSEVYQTPPDSPSADKSAQYFSSQHSNTEFNITDSFSPVPDLETAAASTDTCTVHNSNIDLNPSGVSFRDDHPFSDFETSKSGISADVEVNTITADVTPNNNEMAFQKESHLERKESKDVTSSIPKSSTAIIHETSTSCIPQTSQSSISSIPQSYISSIPHSSTSVILDGFTSNNTVTQSSSSNSYSADTLPEHSSSLPHYITSTEEEDSQNSAANNRNMSASNGDVVYSRADNVSSMPDVIVSSTVSCSRITENSLDADTDRKPILSLSNTDVSERDLSSIPQSLPIITVHSTSDSSLLKESHPQINCETALMESYETNNYSSSTYATVSEKPSPAEPVLLENESKVSLPYSAVSSTYTIIKPTVTFDLSGPSDPISPDHSQRGLSNYMSYSDVETLTEISEPDQISQEASETSSDFPDSGTSSTLTSEAIPAYIIHPPPHLDVSDQLFSSQTPKTETDTQEYEDPEEDVQGASTQESHELIDQVKTTAVLTTRNDLQNKCGPEVEEGSRLDDIYNEHHDVTVVQGYESEQITEGQAETTAESMNTGNDLHMSGKKKYGQEFEEQSQLGGDKYVVPSNQEKDTGLEQIMNVLSQQQIIHYKFPETYEVAEEKGDELQMVQSTKETSAMQGAMEAEVCGGTEVLTGQAEQQIHHLAPLKPALPVNQECGPEECTSATPFSEPVKVSLADSRMETHSHLEICLRPLAPQQSSREITILENTARCKYRTSIDNLAEREEYTSSEETEDIATFLPGTQDSESQEHNSTHTTEETFRHTKDTSHKQGEVTVTKVKTARDNITHRNWVQISESIPDNRRENEDSAEVNAVPDQLLSRSLIPGERFFHASTVLSTVIEESETENQVETETGSDTDMNSGVAVLSTKLSRPSSSREGREDTMVVRKVSLVSTDKEGNFGNYESPLDSIRLRDQSEPSKASPELERRWKSLHSSSEEQQSSFTERSDYTFTDSTYLRSSQLSPSYKKGVYTSHFRSPETQPIAFSETDGSLDNSNWKVGESEVHQSSESYTSGRSRVELSLPVVREGEGEGEQEIRKTVFDSQAHFDSRLMIVEADDYSSDVFQATRVELIPSPTGPEPEPLSSSSFSEMDNLVDTLKSMERPVRQRVQRTPSNTPFSSLPPIEEDAPISPPTPISPRTPISPITEPKLLNGVSSLPLDIGLNWSTPKDMRSPLTMMKEQQLGETQNRGLSLPLRASALNSIVMRRGSLNDLSPEESSTKGLMNGGSSRLENSFFFQPTENGKASNRSIFRAASLPEIGPSHERISSATKGSDALLSSRFERFSYLTSPSNSLSGIAETSRISMAPSVQHNSQDTSSFDHKSTMELYRSLPSETLLKNSQPLGLQRSSSLDGGLLINDTMSFQVDKKPEPERNLLLKYRAFPDAYLTKEKEHGKLNPRPGKMLIYDKPGMTGERIEVRGDVVDATPWEFTDTISIRVIRGGWVLYEKPEFKGEKIALDEGDIELTNPFGPPDEEVVDQQNGTTQDHEEEEHESKPRLKRKFVIGSIRRAVRDYSVPEISLFPDENAEGKKVIFRDTSEDSRIFGFPVRANSIIINAGLWLVFAEPFFQGVPRVLEVGGFPTPAAWGVTHPYVGSLHPLKIGEPRVENLYETKIVLYEKPYFTGKSREIYTSMRDFLSRVDKQQSLFMFSAGSLKVIGGCWVGYEKEGFRGHQYLLEEGEYHDWRVWGGVNSELRSVRVIQADLSEPLLVLYGMPEEEKAESEEPTFEVTEAVADVELFGFGINTRSIHVLSGAWVAYSHVDFSGNQYVLEKGFYNNCEDWGSGDNRICSIQPILAAPSEEPSFRNEVLLYSEPDFQGTCRVCHQNQGCLPERLTVKSCRVVGGSWVLYGGEKFTGNMYVLSEGDYPNLTSMGIPTDSGIHSVKAVPMTFSVPSISLFGLECFEGREVAIDTQISNMWEEGFNTHFLSVRVNSGCWVLCEHSNYRGRQFLLEPIEITNWHKFSSLSCIGSLYPVRQKQRLFRIKNKETGHYISVQGGVEDMKTGRVVVTEQVEGMSDFWLYQDGLIKNKLARTMSLQVMGNVESGAKVVLWTETRVPVQTWSAQVSGTISSVTFPGMVLDIKGGKQYDKQHLVIREENEEHASQQWELEFV